MDAPQIHPFDCPALATDLYQLTMAQAYWYEEMHEPAVFDLFVRRLPPERSYLITAGLVITVAVSAYCTQMSSTYSAQQAVIVAQETGFQDR